MAMTIGPAFAYNGKTQPSSAKIASATTYTDASLSNACTTTDQSQGTDTAQWSNGEFAVTVLSDGEWKEAGSLSFDRFIDEKNLDLSAFLPATGSATIRLTQRGGGAANLDSVLLGNVAPVKVNDAEGLPLTKLSKKDFDLINVDENGVEVTFSAIGTSKVLAVAGRIESTIISKEPYKFPIENLYKDINENSAFYMYKLDSKKGSFDVGNMVDTVSSNQPFFKQYTEASASGHPAGYIYGWVMNDDKNLYVAIDCTQDNTFDGDKDYTKVYVKTASGIKGFKVSVPETTWGKAFFRYTDKVAYQHKVYEFAIPLSELGVESGNEAADLSLAFEVYGTYSLADIPTIDFVTNPINNNMVTVHGTSVPGYIVHVSFLDWHENSVEETALADADGNYSLSNIDVSDLSDGSILVNAQAEAEVEYEGGSYTAWSDWSDGYEVTKETVAVAPANPTIDFVTNPITSHNQHSVVVTGTAEPNTHVDVSISDINLDAHSQFVSPDAEGNYSATFDLSDLADGDMVVSAAVVDAEYESWSSWIGYEGTVIKDTVAEVSITDPANGSRIRNAWPWLDCSLEEGAEITKITLDDGTDKYDITDQDGELSINEGPLEDGDYTVTVEASDSFENTGSASSHFTVDTKAPWIVSTDPEDGDQNVAVGKTITATFSEGINFYTYDDYGLGNYRAAMSGYFGQVKVEDSEGNLVDTENSIGNPNNNVLIIDPVSALSYNTTYTVTIPYASITDLADNPYEGLPESDGAPYVFSFKTEKAPVPTYRGGGDNTPPAAPLKLRLVSSDPVISLAWDKSKESDLAGYNLYRREKGKDGTLKKLSNGLLKKETYDDTSATTGITYIYYVTAVDNSANESGKSNEVEAALTKVKGAIVFSDLPASAYCSEAAARLLSLGAINGYTDGSFRPDRNITRAEFAKMLVVAMGWELENPKQASFPDENSDDWAYKYIETGKAHGVLSGYKDGFFRPGKNISRGEIAKILAMALNLPNGSSSLNDINSHWAKDLINACTTADIVNGYADKTFKPNNPATRCEAAKMVGAALDYKK